MALSPINLQQIGLTAPPGPATEQLQHADKAAFGVALTNTLASVNDEFFATGSIITANQDVWVNSLPGQPQSNAGAAAGIGQATVSFTPTQYVLPPGYTTVRIGQLTDFVAGTNCVSLYTVPNTGVDPTTGLTITSSGQEQTFMCVTQIPGGNNGPPYDDSFGTVQTVRLTNLVPPKFTSLTSPNQSLSPLANASGGSVSNSVGIPNGYRLLLFPAKISGGNIVPDTTQPITSLNPLINSSLDPSASNSRVTVDYKAGIVRLSIPPPYFSTPGNYASQTAINPNGVYDTAGRVRLFAIFYVYTGQFGAGVFQNLGGSSTASITWSTLPTAPFASNAGPVLAGGNGWVMSFGSSAGSIYFDSAAGLTNNVGWEIGSVSNTNTNYGYLSYQHNTSTLVDTLLLTSSTAANNLSWQFNGTILTMSSTLNLNIDSSSSIKIAPTTATLVAIGEGTTVTHTNLYAAASTGIVNIDAGTSINVAPTTASLVNIGLGTTVTHTNLYAAASTGIVNIDAGTSINVAPTTATTVAVGASTTVTSLSLGHSGLVINNLGSENIATSLLVGTGTPAYTTGYLYGLGLDTASANTFNVGNVNASILNLDAGTTVNIGPSRAVTVTLGGTLTETVSIGALANFATDAVHIDAGYSSSGPYGTIYIGTTSLSGTVKIGTGTNVSETDLKAGGASSALNIDTGTAGIINLGGVAARIKFQSRIDDGNTAIPTFTNSTAGSLTAAQFTTASLGTWTTNPQSFTTTLSQAPVSLSSVKIYDGTNLVVTDNGLGGFSGSYAGATISGTIDYSTGALSVTFTGGTPDSGSITAHYAGGCTDTAGIVWWNLAASQTITANSLLSLGTVNFSVNYVNLPIIILSPGGANGGWIGVNPIFFVDPQGPPYSSFIIYVANYTATGMTANSTSNTNFAQPFSYLVISKD